MLASNQNQQGRILNTTNSGAHPKLNQYLLRWSPRLDIFRSPLGDSNVKPRLRTDALNSSKKYQQESLEIEQYTWKQHGC